MLRLLLLPLLLASTAAQPQAVGGFDMQMMQAMGAARAAANRPGDEALACEALEAEIASVANAPALQSFIARSAAAQPQQAAPGTGAQAAMAIFGALGSAFAGLGAGAMQGQAQGQAAANMQQHANQAQEMMTLLPQLMRGQRVIELAQARDCPWMQGMGGTR